MSIGLILFAFLLRSPHMVIVLAQNATSVPSINPSTITPTPTYPSGPPPKIFPSSIRDVPRDDFECWKEFVSYTSISTRIHYAEESEKIKTTTILTTSLSTRIDTQYPAFPTPDTTLCDGWPRVTDKATPSWYGSVSTFHNVTSTWTWYPTKPTCSIESYGRVCEQLSRSAESIISRISSAGYTTDFPLDDPERITQVLAPPCSTFIGTVPAMPTHSCSFDTAKAKATVLYWPPTMAGNLTESFCAPNASRATITASQTIPGRPNTARYRDLVLTSPSIYVILNDIQPATDRTTQYFSDGEYYTSYSNYGSMTGDITLSYNPSATPFLSQRISCTRVRRRSSRCTTSTLPFQFEDLATVPYPLFNTYLNIDPDTVYQASYTPAIPFPTREIMEEDEQWKRACSTVMDGKLSPTYVAVPTEKWRERDGSFVFLQPTGWGTGSGPGYSMAHESGTGWIASATGSVVAEATSRVAV